MSPQNTVIAQANAHTHKKNGVSSQIFDQKKSVKNPLGLYLEWCQESCILSWCISCLIIWFAQCFHCGRLTWIQSSSLQWNTKQARFLGNTLWPIEMVAQCTMNFLLLFQWSLVGWFNNPSGHNAKLSSPCSIQTRFFNSSSLLAVCFVCAEKRSACGRFRWPSFARSWVHCRCSIFVSEGGLHQKRPAVAIRDLCVCVCQPAREEKPVNPVLPALATDYPSPFWAINWRGWSWWLMADQDGLTRSRHFPKDCFHRTLLFVRLRTFGWGIKKVKV